MGLVTFNCVCEGKIFISDEKEVYLTIYYMFNSGPQAIGYNDRESFITIRLNTAGLILMVPTGENVIFKSADGKEYKYLMYKTTVSADSNFTIIKWKKTNPKEYEISTQESTISIAALKKLLSLPDFIINKTTSVPPC